VFVENNFDLVVLGEVICGCRGARRLILEAGFATDPMAEKGAAAIFCSSSLIALTVSTPSTTTPHITG
jgi:hypothetical protein